AAPIWAGFSRVIAELTHNTRLGNLNLVIYGLANSQYNTAGFHDVTIGNINFNGVTGFNAGPGYDQATGWGTIDFDIFPQPPKNWIQGGITPTPTATPTALMTPTPTASMVPTKTPTRTFTGTPTAAPSSTPSVTATAGQTPTSSVTATASTAP